VVNVNDLLVTVHKRSMCQHCSFIQYAFKCAKKWHKTKQPEIVAVDSVYYKLTDKLYFITRDSRMLRAS